MPGMSVELGIGDCVKVLDGPFGGKTGVISSLGDNEVFVRLFMLGRIAHPFAPENLRLTAKAVVSQVLDAKPKSPE
jgi:hypothetical protein